MNLICKHIIIAASALLMAIPAAFAQDNSSASSTVRRGGAAGGPRQRGQNAQAQPGVTQRMQSFYEETTPSDADMQWMRVIYRQINVKEPKNAALYFPEDNVDGQENLFRIIMRLVADGSIPVYEYLDGREIFTDQYRLNVKDMLDRFYIPFTEAKGSTEKNPKYVIDETDVPTTEILSYYAIERWEFDSRTNKVKTRIEALCPVLHRAGDWGGEEMKYPMFWVKLSDLRPSLASQYIFIDDDNNLAKYTYDDFFAMNMYDGEIYKTRNLMNKSMAQLYPDPEEMKHAQDSIQKRLETFDDNIWVPSREELLARRDAKTKTSAKSSDSADDDSAEVAIPSRDDEEKPASTRASRAKKKKTSVKKPKQPKASNSSSNAVRSVRRRK